MNITSHRTSIVACLSHLCLLVLPCRADEPAVSYIFPAGGQRGTKVDFRVGGLYLHQGAAFLMSGPGITASTRIVPTKTVWFEGPLLPLPASQQKEDYPKDYAGQVDIAADAALGVRHWRVSTSQGATASMRFVIGELPEVVEQEIDGAPIPVAVTLPVTINGRIFPREDVDDWTFEAKQGEPIRAEVLSARLGLPLEARLLLYDAQGTPLAEDIGSLDGDACLRVTIPADGTYRLRIHDVNFSGLQHHVYRLTLTRGPFIERVYPLGGRRGSTLHLEVHGQGLPESSAEIAIPPDAKAWHVGRLPFAGQPSNEVGLDADDLPELLENEPNGEPRQAALLSPPVIANGRIGTAGDRDDWAFQGTRGKPLEFALSAARLGSPLDALLVVEDANGKELARAEESPSRRCDTQLHFVPPDDGLYVVRVADRFASRGGRAFAYRLRIVPAGSGDFQLFLATDALTLYRNSQAKLRVAVERADGFNGAVRLAIAGLPEGVTAQGLEAAANQPHAEITFKAEASARIQTARLVITGTADLGGQGVTRTARLAALPGAGPPGERAVDDVLLAVSLPTPFKVRGKYDLTFAPRGSVLLRHYQIDRNDFSGPLTVQLADRQARHLQGVTGPSIVVPAGANECDYPAFLPPWMELARTSRSVVMAVAVVTDADGSQHTVSFTSQNQNEQIVALVAPGELSVLAEHASLACAPDRESEIQVRIAHDKSLAEPVRLELVVPAHIHGIAADPVTVSADARQAVLRLRCGPRFGPLNMPLTIRATADHDGRRVVAETPLELVNDLRQP
jgi:hypothetical protein